MKRSEVFSLIDGERDYQDLRWKDSLSRSVGDFLVYMDDYMRKAKERFTAVEGTDEALDVIRKVTALGVACMEKHGAPRRGEL
jgi:RPA family protein